MSPKRNCGSNGQLCRTCGLPRFLQTVSVRQAATALQLPPAAIIYFVRAKMLHPATSARHGMRMAIHHESLDRLMVQVAVEIQNKEGRDAYPRDDV